jgi:hypothetical protein
VGSAHLCGHQEDSLVYALQCGTLKLGRQTDPLEPVHQVVGQQEPMKVGLVGEIVAGGKVPSAAFIRQDIPVSWHNSG